jgi:hypothetical protein
MDRRGRSGRGWCCLVGAGCAGPREAGSRRGRIVVSGRSALIRQRSARTLGDLRPGLVVRSCGRRDHRATMRRFGRGSESWAAPRFGNATCCRECRPGHPPHDRARSSTTRADARASPTGVFPGAPRFSCVTGPRSRLEIIGLDVGAAATEAFWTELLRSFATRRSTISTAQPALEGWSRQLLFLAPLRPAAAFWAFVPPWLLVSRFMRERPPIPGQLQRGKRLHGYLRFVRPANSSPPWRCALSLSGSFEIS